MRIKIDSSVEEAKRRRGSMPVIAIYHEPMTCEGLRRLRLLVYEEVHFVLGPSSTSSDHGSMLSEVSPKPPQIFWKAFKIWAAIMAVPGALGTFEHALSCFRWGCQYGPPILPTALLWTGAPGGIFGGLGAAALTFLVRSGQKWPAPLVGTVVGFACPVATTIALGIILSKNNDRMGLVIFGFMFAMLGALAGFLQASPSLLKPSPSRPNALMRPAQSSSVVMVPCCCNRGFHSQPRHTIHRITRFPGAPILSARLMNHHGWTSREAASYLHVQHRPIAE